MAFLAEDQSSYLVHLFLAAVHEVVAPDLMPDSSFIPKQFPKAGVGRLLPELLSLRLPMVQDELIPKFNILVSMVITGALKPVLQLIPHTVRFTNSYFISPTMSLLQPMGIHWS